MNQLSKLIFISCGIVSLLFSTPVLAQKHTKTNQNVDSLLKIATEKDDTNAVNARISLFIHYELKDPTKAKFHLDKASQLRALTNYTKGKADVNKYYGFYFSAIGSLDKAEKHLNKSIVYYKKLKNEKNIISCLNSLGVLEGQRGNYSAALEYYLLAKKKNQKLGLLDDVAIVNINIGLVHYFLQDFEMAEHYYQMAYLQLKKQNNLSSMMHVHSKRASNFLALKEYEKALSYLNKALNIAIQLDDYIEQSSIEHIIGSYFAGVGQPDSALVHYNNSIVLGEKLGLNPSVATSYLHVGLIQYNQGNSEKAIKATEKALAMAKETGDQLRVMIAYDLLAEIYRSKGEFKKAFETYKIYKTMSDSIQGADVKNKVSELKIIYEVAEKDNKNKLLQEQNNLKQLKVKQLNTVLIATVILFLLIVFIMILVIRQKRIKTKLIQTELEQKALRTQMNPHFIFNALNSIQRMYIEGKEDIANDYLADFSRLLRTILENSGKRVITLKEEIEITRLYLNLEKLRTDNLIDYVINIEQDLNIENIVFPPLILQPYIENAIWHGIIPNKKNGVITINISGKTQENLLIEIIDNGIGINQSKSRKKESINNSLGMQITSQRLGGSDYVKIEELNTGGTKISLTIKHTK